MRSRVVRALTASLLFAATALTASALSASDPQSVAVAQVRSPANPGSNDVIVHLFQWPWASVAAECRNVLGPKGFGGVQVSPPQEHVVLPGRGHP